MRRRTCLPCVGVDVLYTGSVGLLDKEASTVSSGVMSVEVSVGLPEESGADLKWVMGKAVDEKVNLRTLALYVYSALQSA